MAGQAAGFRVERAAIPGSVSSVRCARLNGRLVDGEIAYGTPLEEGRRDDVPVLGVLVRNGVRLTLDVGHHQASKSRVVGKRHGSNLCHGFSLWSRNLTRTWIDTIE